MKIHVNDVYLFYTKTGSGQPFILSHGNGENHEIFDKIIDLLSARFCVYAIDTRGHGNSSKINTYNYQDIAADFVEFIKKLELKRPVFYGFSDGGIAGIIIASQHPDLLDKLIVSGANVKPQGLKNKWMFLFKTIYFFTRNPKTKMMITQPNINDCELQQIKTPTLVLAGQKDVIKEKHTLNIAAQIQNSRLKIIKGENHGSYVVHSDKLFDIIKDFIDYN
ncbi:MAG: alpha/beta hydrolase [Prevotellaceae bacterium]|jgi:pimeloyl-ACP methyl ester carboxylesterase|nr:alpha/beta hydrolase [Prevotellaceae bacterium]